MGISWEYQPSWIYSMVFHGTSMDMISFFVGDISTIGGYHRFFSWDIHGYTMIYPLIQHGWRFAGKIWRILHCHDRRVTPNTDRRRSILWRTVYPSLFQSCKNQNIMDIYGPLDLGNNFVMLAALIYYKPELICLFWSNITPLINETSWLGTLFRTKRKATCQHWSSCQR